MTQLPFPKTQAGLMSVALIAFCFTSIFSYPQADDWAYAFKTFDWGWWGAQVFEYTNWNGRYVGTALLSSSPLVWGNLSVFRLTPVVLILSLFLSSVFLVKSVLRHRLDAREEWFWGLGLTFLTLMGFFTIPQGIYWLASAYTYTISIAFMNLALAFVWRPSRHEAHFIPAAFLTVLIVGTNETTMVLWLYLLCGTAVVEYLQGRRISWGLLATIGVGIICALVVLKAPGNSLRASEFEKSRQVFRTLGNSFVYSFVYPFKFLAIPIVTFWLLNFDRLRALTSNEFLTSKRWIFLAAVLGMIFISFAPSLWGMGRKPNSRTMNVIFYVYLLGLFPLLTCFIKTLKYRIKPAYLLPLLLVSVNSFELVSDYLSGRIAAYQVRWERMLETRGAEAPHQDFLPRSLHFNDAIGEDVLRKLEAHNPGFFQR